jgi:hypothetical protein
METRKQYRVGGGSRSCIYEETIGRPVPPGFEVQTRWLCSTKIEPGRQETEEERADAAKICAMLNSHGDLLAACEAALALCRGNGYSKPLQGKLAAAIKAAKGGGQ